MDVQPQATPDLKRLAELVGDIQVAMLSTLEADGSLRSRPLTTLQMDDSGALWFVTSISSPKIVEMDKHSRVNLSYSDPARQTFASISGVTQVIRDEAKARELWTPPLLAWFPDGVDDPDLVLLKVTVEEAEFWEVKDGQVSRLFGSAPRTEHGKVRLD